MVNHRIIRLNSLLKQVISEVIRREVHNPHVNTLLTVTEVSISKDLQHARVMISVIGTEEQKQQTLAALESAAGFISVHSAKKVVMRYFPTLTFRLDSSAEKQMRVDSLLHKIHEEEQARENPST